MIKIEGKVATISVENNKDGKHAEVQLEVNKRFYFSNFRMTLKEAQQFKVGMPVVVTLEVKQ